MNYEYKKDSKKGKLIEIDWLKITTAESMMK
jgi:hypothetical protein